jgi:hypothetical protein
MQGVREKGGGLMQLVSVSTSYKLRVQRNHQWVEQDIFLQDLTETVSQEWNGWPQPQQISIPVNDAIKEAFDTAEPGDTFHISIVASYNYSDPKIPDVQKYYPPTPIVFVPKLYWAFPSPGP